MTVLGRRETRYLLAPGAAAGVGGGLLAGASPILAVGLAAVIGLLFLQWNALFALLSFFSITQSSKTGGSGISLNGIVVGGLTFRPAMAVVVPFIIRGYLMTNPALRNRMKLPEYMLLGYFAIVTASSFAYSPDISKSLPTVGLIAFGLVAYYAVYVSVGSAARLRAATRIFLAVILINAIYGIVALFSRLLLGTHFGVSAASDFGPGVFGLSYEHDIFASTCGAGAVMYFTLWREPNTTISSRLAAFGFLTCTVAMLLGLARAAWIGYAVGMLGVIFLTRRGLRRPARLGRSGVILLSATLVGVVASIVFLSAPTGSSTQNTSVVGGIKSKFAALFNVTSGTGRTRASEFRTAVGDVPNSPFIGLGANTYGLRHPLERGKNNYIGDLWLRALYEAGIIGLVLLAGAILLALWPNRTVRASTGSLAPLARAFTFGFLVLVISYAGTDDTLYMWPWIFLALTRASHILANREYRLMRARAFAGPEEPPIGRMRAASPAAGPSGNGAMGAMGAIGQ